MKRSLNLRLLATGFSLLLLPAALRAATAKVRLLSPNHRIEFLLGESPAGLTYSVSMSGKPVIENSAIGITVDGADLAQGVWIGKPQKYKVNETFPWNGVHSTAINRCNGLRIPLMQVASHTP